MVRMVRYGNFATCVGVDLRHHLVSLSLKASYNHDTNWFYTKGDTGVKLSLEASIHYSPHGLP